MWLILFVMLTGLGLSLYKFMALSHVDVNGDKLFDKIKGHILQNNVDEALSLCAGSKSVLAKILRSGLKRANEDRDLIEDAVATSIMENTPKLTYQLNYISLIANSSTLIGLLGTIQGLIMSFAAVGSAEGADKAASLADGIAKAMNTTAFGLTAAIPMILIHSFLATKTAALVDNLEMATVKCLNLVCDD